MPSETQTDELTLAEAREEVKYIMTTSSPSDVIRAIPDVLERLAGRTSREAGFRAYCYKLLGDARMELDQYDEAIDEFTKALEASTEKQLNHYDETQGDIYYLRGTSYERLDLLDEATKDLTDAIKIASNSTRWDSITLYLNSLAHRGYIYDLQGKHELAIADYTTCIEDECNIGDTGSLRSRAESYMAVGKYQEALNDCVKMRIYSPNAAGFTIPCLIFCELGDLEKAQSAYDSARERERDAYRLDECKQKLNELKTSSSDSSLV